MRVNGPNRRQKRLRKGPSGNRDSQVVTFDCYGTLIDWETGIRNSFLNAQGRHRPGGAVDERIFELYEEEEQRIEKDAYHPYREVLSQSVLAVAKKVEWPLTREQSGFLASDLPDWKPYSDTNPALRRLAGRYKLGILSNVDNDLLVGTMRNLAVPFQITVTAEQVRSYKPGKAHFEKARELMGRKADWVHVAGSLYHDIEPAEKLGIRAVWVNRKGSAASRPLSSSVTEVRDLTELADLLGV